MEQNTGYSSLVLYCQWNLFECFLARVAFGSCDFYAHSLPNFFYIPWLLCRICSPVPIREVDLWEQGLESNSLWVGAEQKSHSLVLAIRVGRSAGWAKNYFSIVRKTRAQLPYLLFHHSFGLDRQGYQDS